MTIHNPPKETQHEACRFTTVICQSELEQVLRTGARKLLIAALEAEVEDYVQRHEAARDAAGRRLVVRNGHGAVRRVQTGLGTLEVQAPRVEDRRENERFTSRILPPYLRRTASLENLIAVLYLKGISTSAMPQALEPLLGPQAAGLSAATVVRLITAWQDDYQTWLKRDLSGRRLVYLWADGIYCNVRLTDERPCLLVVVGAWEDGTKELLAKRRRGAGKRTVVARRAARLEGAGHRGAPEAGGGRRRAGVLAGPRAGVARVPAAALLGPQDGQRARQAAAAAAARGQGAAPGDLAGGHPAGRRGGVRALRRSLPGQVSEGDRLPATRPGGMAGVLRLPG